VSEDARRVGATIAAKRNELRLSQTAFGERIDRSVSWVSQVERGVRKIDRMSVLEKVAEVLGIPVSELQPAAVLETAAPDTPRAVSDRALALTASSALRSMLGRPVEPDHDAGTGELIDGVSQAWELAHGSSYGELGEKLLDLLPPAGSGRSRHDRGAAGGVVHRAGQGVSRGGRCAVEVRRDGRRVGGRGPGHQPGRKRR
jgi:transcriptional regulator with XRE-family HTH domain